MSRFTHVVEKFLTPEECQGFIKFSEERGYKESLIRTKDGEQMNKDIRDNDRVIWDNPKFAEQLWELVKDFMPADIEGYEPLGLNERFRFYRYKDGQQFKPHIDAPFKRSTTEKSKITLLLYLNENFTGGATTLILEGKDNIPKEGMLFLFEHKIMHCGRPVTEGVKYVLRTDVMYKLKETKNET
jgi:predicted 2-oxoglutarate/Fe(II)-dependent dioxygenase YbiX